VYEYGVANCEECSAVMLGILHDHFPDMNKESVFSYIKQKILSSLEQQERLRIEQVIPHAYNILNRDFSTPLNAPDTWNEDAVIVDAWVQKVYTKAEFMEEYNLKKNALYNVNDLHPKARIRTHSRLSAGEQFQLSRSAAVAAPFEISELPQFVPYAEALTNSRRGCCNIL